MRQKEGKMTFNQLHYFLEVYSLKSIKKAAEKMYISTQGLSKTIIQLENELENTLFDRTGSSLVPTAYADELYIHAYQIISSYQTITKKKLFAGHGVTLYVADGIMQYLMPGFLKAFFAQFPMVTLNIQSVTCRTANELLKTGEGEMALLLKKNDEPELENIYLGSYDFCIIMNKNNPLAYKDKIYIEDWDNLSLAGRGCAGCKTQCMQVIMDDAKSKGYVPKVKIRTTDDRLSIAMAKDDIASAFVSRAAAIANMSNELKLIDFGDRNIWFHMYLIYRKELPLSPTALLIRQFLLSWCAEHCKKMDGID